MFFVLSKIFGFLALPSNLIMAIGLAGLVLMTARHERRARIGRTLAAAALTFFAVFGLSPAGNALMEPLEDRFPPWDPGRGAPDGIIVLGGAIDPDLIAARGGPDINEAAERVIVVAALARTYPQARIIYTGGNSRLASDSGNEAEAAAPILESFGIARKRLTLEARSRNTAENAIFSKQLAAPRPGERWLIVTSGYHMPRAIGAFRKAGFNVEAYPVDYRTRGPGDLLTAFGDTGSGLRRTDTAAREWIGLLAYWLTGRTSALFPGP